MAKQQTITRQQILKEMGGAVVADVCRWTAMWIGDDGTRLEYLGWGWSKVAALQQAKLALADQGLEREGRLVAIKILD